MARLNSTAMKGSLCHPLPEITLLRQSLKDKDFSAKISKPSQVLAQVLKGISEVKRTPAGGGSRRAEDVFVGCLEEEGAQFKPAEARMRPLGLLLSCRGGTEKRHSKRRIQKEPIHCTSWNLQNTFTM